MQGSHLEGKQIGGWRMADGGWRMADGGWRMADGGWRMADGGWRMAITANGIASTSGLYCTQAL